MTLFDEEKREYRLYDAMRLRFIKLRRKMTEEEAAEGNSYFSGLKCGHLQWRVWQPETKSRDGQKVRSYTIKR